VEGNVAASAEAGLLSGRGARLTGSVARRQDDEIRIQMQVEDLAERQKAVRSAAAEAGQKRGLSSAFRRAGGHDAVRGEMDDPILVRSFRASNPVSVNMSRVTICT